MPQQLVAGNRARNGLTKYNEEPRIGAVCCHTFRSVVGIQVIRSNLADDLRGTGFGKMVEIPVPSGLIVLVKEVYFLLGGDKDFRVGLEALKQPRRCPALGTDA